MELGSPIHLTLNEEERVALIELAEVAIDLQEEYREIRYSENYVEEAPDVTRARARVFRTVAGVLDRLALGSLGAFDGHEVARNARDLAMTLMNDAAGCVEPNDTDK